MSEDINEQHIPGFIPSPEYLARQNRMFDAISLSKPDRVPVAPMVVHYYPTRAKGITNKEAMYNFAQSNEIWKETTLKHNWDVAANCGFFPAKPLELMGITQMAWPGGTLGDNQPFQWVEKEYTTQGEYDELMTSPNEYMIKKYLPRISTVLAPASGAARGHTRHAQSFGIVRGLSRGVRPCAGRFSGGPTTHPPASGNRHSRRA